MLGGIECASFYDFFLLDFGTVLTLLYVFVFRFIVEMAEKPWELFYHSFLNGRSAYIRLIFEELGIPYKDMVKSRDDIVNYFQKGQLGGYPVLFPPVIRKGM